AAGRASPTLHPRNDKPAPALAHPDDDPQRAPHYLELNREFHAAIAEAAGNRRMARLLEELVEHSERVLRLAYLLNNRSQELEHAHSDLVEALIAGDGALARRIMAEHITRTHEWIIQALLASPDLLSAPLSVPGTSVRPEAEVS